MDKVKRILAAFLCMLMITGAAACSTQKSEGGDTSTAVEGETNESEVTTESEKYNAPAESDFDGYVFRVMTDINLMSGNVTIIYAEDMTGEIVNDAIYTRDKSVEDKYNISIEFNESSADNLAKSVKANDDLCDITFPYVNGMFSYAQQGYLVDYNTISTIDLSNPWWDQRIQSDYAVKGKIFGMTGDYTLRNPMTEFVIQYNKKIAEDYNLSDLYQMVWDGSWTNEAFWSMATQVSQDINGDGNMDANDTWGFISEVSAPYYFFIGGSYRSLEATEDGYRITLGDENIVDALESSLFFALDSDNAICVDDGTFKVTSGNSVWTEAYRMFTSNQALFRSSALGDILEYREMKMDYGLLPIPKYSDSQDGYYCLVSSWDDPMVIPITVSDTERTGLIIEALFYASHFELKDAFYDTLLSGKLLRDDESVEMLDLITASKTYDIDWTMDITGTFGILSGIASSKNDTLVSKLAAIGDKAQIKLDKFLENF